MSVPSTKPPPPGRQALRGLAAFLALCIGGVWIPVFAVQGTLPAFSPDVSGLFLSALLYAFFMGWQPVLAAGVVRGFLDREEFVDHGLRPTTRAAMIKAVCLAGGLALAASVLAILLHRGAHAAGSAATDKPGLLSGPVILLLSVALIGCQSLGEELGWRGYALSRMRALFGPVRGLLLHGMAWGLWYAPFFLVGAGPAKHRLLTALAYVGTCSLLGVLLAWMRLAWNSLVPCVFANAVLTCTAGLPLLLQGVDPGVRAAIFRVEGLVPLAACALVLLAVPRLRAPIRRADDVRPLRTSAASGAGGLLH